jgi:hypothetical protein
MSQPSWWSDADQAELDVLWWELVGAVHDHECEACQRCPTAEEWLAHKRSCWACSNAIKFETAACRAPCSRYLERLDHIVTCPACSSCSRVTAAIEAVVNWRHARVLRSRAEHLRSGQELQDFAARIGVPPKRVSELQAEWRAEEAGLFHGSSARFARTTRRPRARNRRAGPATSEAGPADTFRRV